MNKFELMEKCAPESSTLKSLSFDTNNVYNECFVMVGNHFNRFMKMTFN